MRLYLSSGKSLARYVEIGSWERSSMKTALMTFNYMLENLTFYATMLSVDPLQSEQLVDLLLNTMPVSEGLCLNLLSFSHGEYFYSLFKTTINTELLRQLEIAVPLLMKASSENPTMVVVSPCFS